MKKASKKQDDAVSDTTLIAFRVPVSWIDEADQVARAISRPGFKASRTDAFRAAIAAGLEKLRKESR